MSWLLVYSSVDITIQYGRLIRHPSPKIWIPYCMELEDFLPPTSCSEETKSGKQTRSVLNFQCALAEVLTRLDLETYEPYVRIAKASSQLPS